MTKTYFVVTEELWKMRVEYTVEADSPEDAIQRVKDNSVAYDEANNLESDEVTEVISIEEETSSDIIADINSLYDTYR